MIDWKYLRKGGERTVQGAFGLQGAYVQKRQTLNLVNWVKWTSTDPFSQTPVFSVSNESGMQSMTLRAIVYRLHFPSTCLSVFNDLHLAIIGLIKTRRI